MPTWPSELPQEPNNGDYKETTPDVLMRDKNEVGPDGVRRRAKAAVRKLILPYRFTASQTDIFDAWLENDLQDGALSFTMNWPPLPRFSRSVEMRLITPITYTHKGGGACDVDLQVEIMP